MHELEIVCIVALLVLYWLLCLFDDAPELPWHD